jgi:hypothetical protein
MIPNTPADYMQPTSTDDQPRYFLDDSFDASTDGDWWLDLGCVNLPNVPIV